MAVNNRAGRRRAAVDGGVHRPFAGGPQRTGVAAIEPGDHQLAVAQLLRRHAGRRYQHPFAETHADIAGSPDIQAASGELAIAFDDGLADRRLGAFISAIPLAPLGGLLSRR